MNWRTETKTLKDGTSFPVSFSSFPAYRAAPHAPAWELQVARLGDPGSPAIVFLAGGPGDSGIGWLDHPPFAKVFLSLASQFQILFLDQRGCGGSEPRQVVPPLGGEAGEVWDEARLLRRFQEQGQPTPWLTPALSAFDVVSLIQACGLERAHLWGYSYGTHLAQAVLRHHEHWIDRVVLCGFEGPDQTYKTPSQIQNQMVRIATLAKNQGVSEDLLPSLENTFHQMDETPILLPNQCLATSFVAKLVIASWCGLANRFALLPKLLAELRAGQSELLWQGFSKLAERKPVFYAKDSASHASSARLERIQRETSGTLLGNAANFPFPAIGAAYGVEPLPDHFREPLATGAKIFCLTGSLDGFTPTANCLEHEALMPNLIHAEIENASHSDLISCPEANEAIARFFAGEELTNLNFSLPEPRFRV